MTLISRLLGALCLLCCALQASPKQTEKEAPKTLMYTLQEHTEALLKATHRYIDFINRVGKGEVFPQRDEAAIVIASDCQKIFNGHLFAKNREDFVADLLSVHENHGSWQIVPVEVIKVPLDNIVILRIIIESDNFGTNTAIVILRYNSNYLITEINEVFNQVKGSYDFEHAG